MQTIPANQLLAGLTLAEPVAIRAVVTDSRKVEPGCVFVCFPGERVDGHDYAAGAYRSGAEYIVANHPVEGVPADRTVIVPVSYTHLDVYKRQEFSHIPVLLQPCLDGLNIDPAGIYLDGTAGGAGHSREIAKRLTTGRLISLDQDPDAVTVATERLKGLPAQVVQVNFREAARVLAELGIPAVNGAPVSYTHLPSRRAPSTAMTP